MTPSVCRFPVRLSFTMPFRSDTELDLSQKKLKSHEGAKKCVCRCTTKSFHPVAIPQVTVEQLEYLWQHFTAKERDPAAGGGKEAEEGE